VPTIALVAEGITDQVVLDALLQSFTEVELRYVQPPRDATDLARAGDYGGWERVLETCASDEFKQALQFNDAIIVHIDTDDCEHANFGIALTQDGVDKSVQVLVEEVTAFLRRKIDATFLEEYKARIFFAIAVHSIDCWLLPLYGVTAADKSRTKNCFARLCHVVNAKHGSKCEKTVRCYQRLAKPLTKVKNLTAAAERNESLQLFLASLGASEEVKFIR
jgi:hypothetical protein